MKKSNLGLSILASGFLGLAVGSTMLVLPQRPTAVISIPVGEGVQGGGFNIVLPEDIPHDKATLLAMAYDIAKKDGHKHPELLQGILLQETKAGTMSSYKVAGQEFGLKPNERYYGVAQLKLSAARAVLAQYPTLKTEYHLQTSTDEEIIANLMLDPRFNLSVASKYLLILEQYGYNTVKQLATAYNLGPSGARGKDVNNNSYSKGVMAHLQSLELR